MEKYTIQEWFIGRGMDKTTYSYVYIIQSLNDTDRFYTGFTETIENHIFPYF